MVAGMILHMKSLRKMKTGYGPDIREMLAEAENERMHLMFFIEIAKPNIVERLLVLFAQLIFMIFYAILYTISYKTAHRMIAYFEEEAVKSYTEYLALVENGDVENVPAPELAIKYYKMKKTAKLSDLIKKVRADEQHQQSKSSMQMEIHHTKEKMDSKKIIDALHKGVVTVVFKKLDTGEIRTMPCTLNNDIPNKQC